MSFQEFECLEPELQERVSQCALEELDPVTRKRWEQHLEICHACREQTQMDRAIGDLLAEGVGVPLAERVRVRRWRRSWGRLRPQRLVMSAGSAALLSLLLALAVPPSSNSLLVFGERKVKSDREVTFQINRPVEGEVLYLSGGDLEWSSVDNARFYRVTLESLDGEFTWTGTASSPALPLPEGSGNPGDYMAAVEPYPEGLAPEGHQSVSFRRDRILPFLFYRLSHLPKVSAAFALLSLLFAGLAVIKRT